MTRTKSFYLILFSSENSITVTRYKYRPGNLEVRSFVLRRENHQCQNAAIPCTEAGADSKVIWSLYRDSNFPFQNFSR